MTGISRRDFLKLAGLGLAGAGALAGSIGPGVSASAEGEPLTPSPVGELPPQEFLSDHYQLVALSVPDEYAALPQITAEEIGKVGTVLERLVARKDELAAAGVLPLESGTYGVHFSLIPRYPAELVLPSQPEDSGKKLVFSLEPGAYQNGQFLGGSDLLVPVNLVEGYPPTYFMQVPKADLPASFDQERDALVANPRGGNVVFLYDRESQGYTQIWEANGNGPFPIVAEFRPVGGYRDRNANTFIPRFSLDSSLGRIVKGRGLNNFYEGVVMYKYSSDEGYFFVELVGNNATTLNPVITPNVAITHRVISEDFFGDIMLRIPERVDFRDTVVVRDGFAETATYTVARVGPKGELRPLRSYRANVNEDDLSASFLEPISQQGFTASVVILGLGAWRSLLSPRSH